MILSRFFSEYPYFFSSGDNQPSGKVELSFAGFNKDDIKATIEHGDLVVTAENDERGKKTYRVLLGSGILEDDLSLKYSHGLLTVTLKPKKEERKQISIE